MSLNVTFFEVPNLLTLTMGDTFLNKNSRRDSQPSYLGILSCTRNFDLTRKQLSTEMMKGLRTETWRNSEPKE